MASQLYIYIYIYIERERVVVIVEKIEDTRQLLYKNIYIKNIKDFFQLFY